LKIAITALIFLSILMIIGIACADETSVISVGAVILSKGNCRFTSSTANLSFGSLDPSNPIDKNVTTTVIFRCQANGNNLVTFSITDDDGRYRTGPGAPRMKHTTQTEYLPYSLTLNPSTGSVPKVTETPLTISGTVRGVDYENALPGDYSDGVVVSIEP
jgi:spore coat protein U-like protein